MTSAGIIGKSDKMQDVFEKIKIIALRILPCLLMEKAAQVRSLLPNAIHYNSPRKNEAFIKVSCAALPETLLEAELFGHERGIYRSVKTEEGEDLSLRTRGLSSLMRLGEINQTVQVKLLRVLQEREFERLGGTSTISVDVRIIGATQRDLKKRYRKAVSVRIFITG